MGTRTRWILPLAAVFVFSAAGAEEGVFVVRPTVFLVEKGGELWQVAEVQGKEETAGEFTAEARIGKKTAESKFQVSREEKTAQVLLPLCGRSSCRAEVEIRGAGGAKIFSAVVFLAPPRRWKIFVAPFSHVDVGFTNSQRKILAQNFENLRAALLLIKETAGYPEGARFKFFTEVTWPLFEFLRSAATADSEKAEVVEALRAGEMELGGFFISHQNKFMPSEAVFRSLEFALALNRELGFLLRTACLNDLMDLSAVVKPLHSAGIPYLLGGPNTSRWVTPPLFYLQPAAGEEKVLVWLTPHLNGYGENFDFAMRPALPVTSSALAEIAARLGPYLRSLEEEGAPPAVVREHFDFFGAHWPYPYDIYFLPFYPAHAVDNGPQDLTASELARAWNAKYAFPRLIVATPSEFFAEAEKRYRGLIPVLRGELSAFWGEQIFFAMAQVDPEKEAGQREFERRALLYEEAAVWKLLHGETFPDLSEKISHGFALIALNNDHNPGPVPFGHTSYTKDDVAEWKQTRRQWVAEIDRIAAELAAGAEEVLRATESRRLPPPPSAPAVAVDRENESVLENEFYQIIIDKKTGGIRSLFDKELDRELAGRDGPFLPGQYVIVARGENAGLRGNLFGRPGFVKTAVEITAEGPERAAVKVSGRPTENRDALQALALFIEKALGLRLPVFAIRAAASVLGLKFGALAEAAVEMELRAGEKTVFFTTHLAGARDQAVDHTLAFPLNIGGDRSILVDGVYAPYHFAPVPPWGEGEIIPAARMKDTNFPGINDLTIQFEWIQGLPPDVVFRNYVLIPGDGFGVAFSCRESGVIFPGPLKKDPLHGPFGGGFYHLLLGWTAYGHAFLGAPRHGDFVFHSRLTSFPAPTEAAAKSRAAEFAHDPKIQGLASLLFSSSSAEVVLLAARPLSDRAFLLRLQETGGVETEALITIPPLATISSACRARSDGRPEPDGELPLAGNAFHLKLGPAEVAEVRVEIK